MNIRMMVYQRLPDRVTRFPVVVLSDDGENIVTVNLLNPSKPLVVEGVTLLEKDYFGIWFFNSKDWYDIGAIYDPEKTFKGYYCDLCSPFTRVVDGYELTDFFLDLWIFPESRYLILDQEEFQDALTQGWISLRQSIKVKEELKQLIKNIQSKRHPSTKIKAMLILPRNIDEILDILTHQSIQE